MRRIAVIGISGGGKSTLARRIGAALDLPVVHLDQHFHLPNFRPPPRNEWLSRYETLEADEAWVMDGNYNGTFATRFARADLIVHVQSPGLIAVARVIRRSFSYRGKPRPEAAPGCIERPCTIQFVQFLWWVARFNARQLPKLEAALRTVPAERIVVVRSFEEADALVAQLSAVR